MLGFCSRETNVSMPRAVTEKVAAHFPVPFVREPREKARTGRMWRKRERALLSPLPPFVSVGSQCAGVVSSSLHGRGARPIRCGPDYSSTLHSFWLRTRYKSSQKFPGSRRIYTRFVEIVMNLRPTILPLGPAQKAPSFDFSSVRHIL